jgi:hypothetical protein
MRTNPKSETLLLDFTARQLMRKTGCLLLLAFIALWSSSSTAQSDCSNRQIFSGDDDPCLDKAAPPSPAIVAAILVTDAARQELEDADPSERARIPKLLKGLAVHLASERQTDMIVRGDFPMSGGDNTWFWIITSADSKPVATWVQANTVTVLRSRHNGYRDVRTDWFAGSHRDTQVFRYDGHSYKLYREKYKDLPV